ncbi:hypothetical protein IT570_03360 [Candidatus Sumerlaeota bacterium]|nr:hypothetical protein [Candidatus Sumerlaeota bacterium]
MQIDQAIEKGLVRARDRVAVRADMPIRQLDLFGVDTGKPPRAKKEKIRVVERYPSSVKKEIARYPNAVCIQEPGGAWRWYIPVPEGGDQTILEVNAQEILRKRKNPIGVTQLAKLIGVSRHEIHRRIDRGEFPEGSVLCYGGTDGPKTRHRKLITPAAALAYYESLLFDPRA